MSISFSLSNFKGFKEVNPIELKPLTVICGTNNSGKSSLIQSLLLMKQSNVEDTKIILNDYVQEPLIFNGIYAHLGDFLDVVNNHSNEKEIKFYWKIKNYNLDQIIDTEITVNIKNIENDKSTGQQVVSYFSIQDCTRDFYLEIIRKSQNKYELKIYNISLEELFFYWISSKYSNHDFFDLMDLRKKFTSTKFYQQKTIPELLFNDVQVNFEGIFPNRIIINNFANQSYDIVQTIKTSFMGLKGVPKYLLQFIDITIHNLEDYIQKSRLAKDKYTNNSISEGIDLSKFKKEDRHFFMHHEIYLFQYISYEATVLFLRKCWLKFRYIEPIREAPKRFYLFDDLKKINIGINGEYTALVLAVEKEMNIAKYYRCIYDGKKINNYELREQDKLLESVNWWLFDFMKLPQIYSVDGFKGVINQVKLNSLGVEVDLPDVGFGVSQILPIIVECLRTGQGETIILEQPEIHLHPSLQSKLADFFVCMAKSGKNLVIETHSEHLINRLCLRIAQEDTEEIRDMTNILFVSFDEQNKTSICNPIEVNKYGEIENWPVGFFDENDSRDLLAATLKKRMSGA